MRRNFTNRELLRLLKAATILSIGGFTAGCSSDVIRFSDGFYTGAVPQATAPVQATSDYGQPNYDPNIDNSMTGSIPQQPSQSGIALPRPSDSVTAPPHPPAAMGSTGTPYPPRPGGSDQAAPAYSAPTTVSPVTTASIPPAQPRPAGVDSTVQTGTVRTSAPDATMSKEGWTTAGGTQVVMRNGETIYNLSRRYGVPANAIMEANGISDPKAVHAGQRVLIPTYVYSRSVGVSAPDRNPSVKSASSGIGNKLAVPANNAPTPASRPATRTISLAKQAAPAPQREAVAASGGRYTVAAGDTLSAISRRTGASVESIKQVNGLNTDMVRIGQSLVIPGLSASAPTRMASARNLDPVRTGTVARTDVKPAKITEYTPPKQTVKTTEGSITRIETQASAAAPESTGVKVMRWPVQGRIVSAFGSNSGGKPNDGVDISVPSGTPVKAAENGVVIYAGDGLKELGKTVLVRHSDGIVTVYGHVSDIDVKRGDTVKRGQQIAASGMSGSAKQPQLHFEVRKNSAPVNPATYLE